VRRSFQTVSLRIRWMSTGAEGPSVSGIVGPDDQRRLPLDSVRGGNTGLRRATGGGELPHPGAVGEARTPLLGGVLVLPSCPLGGGSTLRRADQAHHMRAAKAYSLDLRDVSYGLPGVFKKGRGP
jgi:hypothetical protein